MTVSHRKTCHNGHNRTPTPPPLNLHNCPPPPPDTSSAIHNTTIALVVLVIVFKNTAYLAYSADILLVRVSVTILLPPSVRRWGMGEGKVSPPPPLSFLLPIVYPLGRTFFLSSVFHCLKNSRWRQNVLRCERSYEEISPGLQATAY